MHPSLTHPRFLKTTLAAADLGSIINIIIIARSIRDFDGCLACTFLGYEMDIC